MSSSESKAQFGGLLLPPDLATQHFLFVGTTGSGKTTLLRLLEQSTLNRIGIDPDCRAIVNDPKLDVIPHLAAIAPKAKFVISNPFDERSTAWDLAADIIEPQVAIEFAYSLIPHQPESQPFFSDASRHLVVGVVMSFMLSKHDWTLGDLLRVFQSQRALKSVLKRHPETRDLVPLYLAEKRLASNILSTVATKLLPFGPVAAAWEHARQRMSLQKWAQSGMIWILGNSDVSRVPMQTLNRCMFKRACDLTLSASESTSRRNYFILDELADMARLDGLVSVAKKGRSKGASVAIAFQSVAGLRDAQMYGPHFTEELLAQFGNKAIGRVECPSSAEWASKLVGDQEVRQKSTSETSSSHGHSSTKNIQNVIRPGILPSQVMDLPLTNVANGLTALFFIPDVGVFQDTLDGEELFHHQLIPPKRDVPGFAPRPIDHQYLRPWTREQTARFGIPEARPKRPTVEQAEQQEPPRPRTETTDRSPEPPQPTAQPQESEVSPTEPQHPDTLIDDLNDLF